MSAAVIGSLLELLSIYKFAELWSTNQKVGHVSLDPPFFGRLHF